MKFTSHHKYVQISSSTKVSDITTSVPIQNDFRNRQYNKGYFRLSHGKRATLNESSKTYNVQFQSAANLRMNSSVTSVYIYIVRERATCEGKKITDFYSK